jgi:hypothetical protein
VTLQGFVCADRVPRHSWEADRPEDFVQFALSALVALANENHFRDGHELFRTAGVMAAWRGEAALLLRVGLLPLDWTEACDQLDDRVRLAFRLAHVFGREASRIID